jgi:exodeoxyribonuclease VII small subunit
MPIARSVNHQPLVSGGWTNPLACGAPSLSGCPSLQRLFAVAGNHFQCCSLWRYTREMAKKNQIPPKNFEEGLKELETILNEIEGGEIGLEQSLIKYERGTFLIQHCRGVLTDAEKQVEMLSKGPDGSLRSEPMGDEDQPEIEEES